MVNNISVIKHVAVGGKALKVTFFERGEARIEGENGNQFNAEFDADLKPKQVQDAALPVAYAALRQAASGLHLNVALTEKVEQAVNLAGFGGRGKS